MTPESRYLLAMANQHRLEVLCRDATCDVRVMDRKTGRLGNLAVLLFKDAQDVSERFKR